MKDYSRKPRTYKASDEVYDAAMKRAKRERTKLSNVIEQVVFDYASGYWMPYLIVLGDEKPVRLKRK